MREGILHARCVAVATVFCAAVANAHGADLLDQVIARATEIAGSSFQSCGEYTTDSGEECLRYAYEHKLPAIGFFSVNGKLHQAAEARVLLKDGGLVTVSAYSDRPGLTEYRCIEPFLAVEFTKKRVRCRDKYSPPLGAKILRSRPVWFTRKEEHPVALRHPNVPDSVCPSLTTDAKAIAQLLVDRNGGVPEVQLILVPPGCSGKEIENVLKRWRYSPPKKDGKPVATVEVIEISFKK